MWMQFFRICDFFCNFIPGAARRAAFRQNKLYDWRRKYDALRAAFPELDFHHVKMIKGGWNIGFIVDRRYVFKISKKFEHQKSMAKILREQRITNAMRPYVSVRIPKIDIVETGQYTFYKYDFIPGRNMNTFSAARIAHHAAAWGEQIGEFIYGLHHANAPQIDDLKDRIGDGWNHNDICNNVIVDPKTMKIVGIIDWEYSGWGTLETEFNNCVRFSRKIKESGIREHIEKKYCQLNKRR